MLKKYLIIISIISYCFIDIVYGADKDFDFVIDKEISNNYITIIDPNNNGNWELKVNTINNSARYLVLKSRYDDLAKSDINPLFSNNNSSFLKTFNKSSKFIIKPELQLVQKLGSIKEIKLFIEKGHLEKGQNSYIFTGDCQINNIKDAFATINFLEEKDGIFLTIKNISLIEPFQVDASCFDSQPRSNASDYQINFSNTTDNPTNIHIFADCGIGTYDFSDYPDHGGRKIKLNPGQNYTFKIIEGGWKKLKYRFTKNLTPMSDGEYQSIDVKKLKKKKKIDITINSELVKEAFGTRETFDLANSFGTSKKQQISYILDKYVHNPKEGTEFAIINNKVVFPTANIDKIRHLSINGVPAVIDEANKKIKKATDPILVIIDLNFVDPNKKQSDDFRNIINDIYTKTHNSNIHLYKYLNQFPGPEDRNHIFQDSEFYSSLGLSGIYMLNFDKSDPKKIRPISTDLKIHTQFPYIDENNWTIFQEYIKGVDVAAARIDEFGVWSFEPILSSESLNRIGNTTVGESVASGNYIRTFRNTVLNTDEGYNNILPSSSEAHYKKIYYLSYNEPTIKTVKEADKFNKQYEVIFIQYTDYNQIFK